MPEAVQTTGHVRLGSNAGQPMTRRDGLAKVTGQATYAADNHPRGLLHAVIASATIARGRVTDLDVAAARAHPGVVEVITPENVPSLAVDPNERQFMLMLKTEALQDDTVRYAGQPIAMVIAETLEAATEGARLLAPRYMAEVPSVGFDTEIYQPASVGFGAPASAGAGDVEAGLAAAVTRVETPVATPMQYHNAMEPHAMVAEWHGDKLTIDMPNQAIGLARGIIAAFLGMEAEDITLRSPYLGGGFGSKAAPIGPYLLTMLGAKMVGRPLKMVLRREQLYGPITHRAATRQTVTIGLDAEGHLTALDHHSIGQTSRFDEFIEPAANASLNLYATPAVRARHEAVRADVGTPGAVRAPGEASGLAALELAMDEAADAAGMDPLAFRLMNYAETDPTSGNPYSAKSLRECYRALADHFGWDKRPMAPRQMRDEDGHLVGWGMASALFPAPMFQARARATLRADGTALVESSTSDMGQGAWTALAQIAADGLGLPAEKVDFHAGHSDQPDGGVAGGSALTATAGSALFAAGSAVIDQLAEIATTDPESPLFGAGNARLEARDGRLFREGEPDSGEPFTAILARAGLDSLTGDGTGGRDPEAAKAHAMFSHGAVMAEVKVDPDLGQVRVTRLIGAFAAGKIINPHLARSQLTGGMIWGIGFALTEEGIHDPRTGRAVNGDLAGYHVPVNADAPHVEALMIDEVDPFVNALGIKGVGEIGITGAVGAIGNAIWHATGRRVHSYPVHPESLI